MDFQEYFMKTPSESLIIIEKNCEKMKNAQIHPSYYTVRSLVAVYAHLKQLSASELLFDAKLLELEKEVEKSLKKYKKRKNKSK